jgi:hypothetical protein
MSIGPHLKVAINFLLHGAHPPGDFMLLEITQGADFKFLGFRPFLKYSVENSSLRSITDDADPQSGLELECNNIYTTLFSHVCFSHCHTYIFVS